MKVVVVRLLCLLILATVMDDAAANCKLQLRDLKESNADSYVVIAS